MHVSVYSSCIMAKCSVCQRRPGRTTACRCGRVVGPCHTHHTCAARPNMPGCTCDTCTICAGPSLPLPPPPPPHDQQPEPEPEPAG